MKKLLALLLTLCLLATAILPAAAANDLGTEESFTRDWTLTAPMGEYTTDITWKTAWGELPLTLTIYEALAETALIANEKNWNTIGVVRDEAIWASVGMAYDPDLTLNRSLEQINDDFDQLPGSMYILEPGIYGVFATVGIAEPYALIVVRDSYPEGVGGNEIELLGDDGELYGWIYAEDLDESSADLVLPHFTLNGGQITLCGIESSGSVETRVVATLTSTDGATTIPLHTGISDICLPEGEWRLDITRYDLDWDRPNPDGSISETARRVYSAIINNIDDIVLSEAVLFHDSLDYRTGITTYTSLAYLSGNITRRSVRAIPAFGVDFEYMNLYYCASGTTLSVVADFTDDENSYSSLEVVFTPKAFEDNLDEIHIYTQENPGPRTSIPGGTENYVIPDGVYAIALRGGVGSTGKGSNGAFHGTIDQAILVVGDVALDMNKPGATTPVTPPVVEVPTGVLPTVNGALNPPTAGSKPTSGGDVNYTKIVAYIDDKPIRSYNINDNTHIVVEDLAQFGFEVQWIAEGSGRLIVTGRRTAAPAGYTTTYTPPVGAPTEGVAMQYQATNVTTWLGDVEVVGYNIGGYTCIWLDELAHVFDMALVWDGVEGALRMTSKMP